MKREGTGGTIKSRVRVETFKGLRPGAETITLLIEGESGLIGTLRSPACPCVEECEPLSSAELTIKPKLARKMAELLLRAADTVEERTGAR